MLIKNNRCITIINQSLTGDDKKALRTFVVATNHILLLIGRFYDGVNPIICVGMREENYDPIKKITKK